MIATYRDAVDRIGRRAREEAALLPESQARLLASKSVGPNLTTARRAHRKLLPRISAIDVDTVGGAAYTIDNRRMSFKNSDLTQFMSKHYNSDSKASL